MSLAVIQNRAKTESQGIEIVPGLIGYQLLNTLWQPFCMSVCLLRLSYAKLNRYGDTFLSSVKELQKILFYIFLLLYSRNTAK